MVHNIWWRPLRDPEISHACTNFQVAAGLAEGEHHGPRSHDGDVYKWLEAVVYVYAASHDPQLDQLVHRIIALVGKVQRDDGTDDAWHSGSAAHRERYHLAVGRHFR